MRDYGQIQNSYWTDPDIQELSIGARMFGAYLLTNSHTNSLGAFHLPIGYVISDMKLDYTNGFETVSKWFDELFQRGFCTYCEASNWLYIPNFMRWNRPANGNIAKSLAKLFESVPLKCCFYLGLVKSMLEYCTHWDDDFRNRLETLSKPTPTHEHEHEHESNSNSNELLVDPDESTDAEKVDIDKPKKPKAKPVDNCDHQMVLRVWREVTKPVGLMQPLDSAWQGSASCTNLRARWRSHPEHQTEDFWRGYFNFLVSDNFYTGGNERGWKVDIHWSLKKDNFNKRIEAWANAAEVQS